MKWFPIFSKLYYEFLDFNETPQVRSKIHYSMEK